MEESVFSTENKEAVEGSYTGKYIRKYLQR